MAVFRKPDARRWLQIVAIPLRSVLKILPSGRSVALLLAGVTVLAGLLPAATASASASTGQAARSAILPVPSGDAFYVPPNPLPSGNPGDIIWYRSSVSPVADANAWQILYLSTTAGGAPTAVSGTVIVPTAAYPGIRPLAAYAAGTQGWGPQCAPSKEIVAGDFDEEFAVNNLLAKGWAVVVTDYPGLGTPGPEDYNVGIPEGYAVLDSLRAALRLPSAGLSATAPVGIEGYSQGGGAAGWAAQLHYSYAPDLNLKGVAMGGTPANLQAVAANINGTAFFAFLAGSAIGFGTAYPSLNLDSYLNAAGKAAFAQLNTMCQAQGLLTFAFGQIQDYTVGGVNPINDPSWEAVLNENDLGAMKPDVPVLETHGLLDEVIPYSVETTLHSQYCALGVTAQLNSYVGDHVLTALLDQTDVVNWLSGRFGGQPAPENC
jgi:secretory lipase